MISIAALQQIIICLLIICFPSEQSSPTIVNNYGQECAIIRPSKKDTDGTLQQIARENARCRAARNEKKK